MLVETKEGGGNYKINVKNSWHKKKRKKRIPVTRQSLTPKFQKGMLFFLNLLFKEQAISWFPSEGTTKHNTMTLDRYMLFD